MIVSVANGDFYYRVYLNFRRLKYCVSADDEKGEAVIFRLKHGDVVIKANGSELERERVRGRIRIRKIKC